MSHSWVQITAARQLHLSTPTLIMSKNRSKALQFGIVACFVGAAVGGSLYVQHLSPPEPVYKGKPLSTWLNHHVPSSAARPPYGSVGWKEAHQAIQTVGSNSVPTLVRMLSSRDKPKWLLDTASFVRNKGLPISEFRSSRELHEEAEYAFEILGSEAVSAVPELIRIYEQNISRSSRRCAAGALGNIGKGAQDAVPILIRNFSHSDPEVRWNAVTAVIGIRGNPPLVIPALTAALADSSVNVRWNALAGLSYYGRRAQSAVPKIMEMLSDPGMVGDAAITNQVATTIWRIAPEKIPQRLVVENSSPIVHGGRTVQTLKAQFSGERKPLIHAGKAVPTGGQYWNSDPRPFLSLYRGDKLSDENDTFLGDFEILNIPELSEGETLNISTLCVIAGDKIILCARENHHDTFLSIRRITD